MTPLPPAAATGRPRRYCSAACRQSVHARRVRRRPRHAWWTPEPLRSIVTDVISPVLDAAACAESTLVAGNWFGPSHSDRDRRDALTLGWAANTDGGWAWCNPPYQPTPLLRGFLDAAHATALDGSPVAALIPASVGTRWYIDTVAERATAVWVIPGRLAFDGPHSVGDVAPWSSVLAVYAPAGRKREAKAALVEIRARYGAVYGGERRA